MKKSVLFAAFLATTTPVFAQEASDVIATVNGTEITLGELIAARNSLPPQYQQLPPEVLFTGLIDQLIQQQLLADTLEEVPDRVELTLKNEERSLKAGEVVNTVTSSAVTEELVNEAYEAMFDGQELQSEWNASHILVETEEEAAAARDRALAGEEFADLARELSTGPSGPSGGELGWFGPGMMVAPFEEAVSNMAAGDVSDPVQTQFGWHIVKLNDLRQQERPGLDQVRAEIEGELQQGALETLLTDLQRDADITRPAEGEVDPSLIFMDNLLEP